MKAPYVRPTRGNASFGMNDAASEVADGLHDFQVRHFFGGALFTNQFGGAAGLAEQRWAPSHVQRHRGRHPLRRRGRRRPDQQDCDRRISSSSR